MEYQRYQLRDIGDIVSGATPKTTVAENFGGAIPWLTPADLSGYTQKYISRGKRNLTQLGYDSCSTQIMPSGTVLFSSRAPIGYTAIAKNPICTNQGFKSIVPKPFVNSEFLYYQLIYLRKTIQDMGSGTTFKEISAKKFGAVQVTIPPLVEQEHIISRIEELFSQLDVSVNELKTAKERLKVYRQAVLNSCLGDGTLRSIGECIKSMGQGWSPKCERISIEDDDSWAVITTTAIQPMNFSFKENKKLPDSLEPRVKHELKVGDLLITRAGPRSRCGVCCMVKQTKKRLLNCDKVYCLKVNDLIVLPEYMEAVLNAPNFQREIAFCKTGGNDSGVNLTQSRFLSIEVPTPSLDIQKMILAKIDANLSVCDSIEKTVDTALQQVEALRQSILKKAFEGGL